MTDDRHRYPPAMAVAPLAGLRVLQLDGDIETAYCTKMLVDAGADVVIVEPPDGHPLRHRSATGGDLTGRNGPLFDYLAAGTRSVGAPDPHELDELLARTDVAVAATLAEPWEQLHARHRHLSVVVVSAFGTDGPWADHPASDLTLQAMSGGMAPRGPHDGEPLMVGGEPSSWFAASVAATALLGVLGRIRATGEGELIDVSMLETTNLQHTMHPVTFHSMAGRPFHESRGVPIPGIEPTSDGWIGFFVITGQQWLDFCSMIGRADWRDDESLFLAVQRRLRTAELQGPIREWTSARTTEEILELASLLRIPVAPIGTGATLPVTDHFQAEEWYVDNPAGFVQPRRPYRFAADTVAAAPPAPAIGSTSPAAAWATPRAGVAAGPHDGAGELPLAGLRVADFTGFWAGPMASGILAGLGAEVIHIEGPRRPDGIRMNTIADMAEPGWWEWSPLFCGTNTNKRGLVVDLASAEGHEVARRLLGTVDVMIENFSPRVVEQLGLAPEATTEWNPRLVVCRMPAFGLSGPWRDRVGFAQTIEQASGLAFLTGRAGAPTIPNGMCDPLAGVHGAFATLVALAERDRTGRGQVVEAPMIGAALNTSAEQVLEFAAFGQLMVSDGNRSPMFDQDVYRCAGEDRWVAVSAPDARIAAALRSVVGDPDADGDVDPEIVAGWCRPRSPSEVVEALVGAGVPAAEVVWPHQIVDNPQLQARGYFEQLDHPVCGEHPYVSFPARLSAGPSRWNRSPSPTMGQHNGEVLAELGYDADEIAELRAAAVVAEGVVSDQHGW